MGTKVEKGNGRKAVKDAIQSVEIQHDAKKVPAPKGSKSVRVSVQPIRVASMKVRLVGDTPYISHPHVGTDSLPGAQDPNKFKEKRVLLTPQQEFEGCIYRTVDEKPGMPASAFKKALISAAGPDNGVPKTTVRQTVHVVGNIIPIKGRPEMFQVPAKQKGKFGSVVAVMRTRAIYKEWETEVEIRYDERRMSPDVLVNLLNIAGFGVGVGDWRPERDGSYGTFHVKID